MTPYYQEDGIEIYHGNCREILPLLKPDVIVTDPPYGVGIEYASYDDELAATTAMVVDFVRIAVSVSRCVAFSVGKFDTEKELYRVLPPASHRRTRREGGDGRLAKTIPPTAPVHHIQVAESAR